MGSSYSTCCSSNRGNNPDTTTTTTTPQCGCCSAPNGCCYPCWSTTRQWFSDMFAVAPEKPTLPTKPKPDERPKPPSPPTHTEDTKVLSVTGWDWRRSSNGSAHHTARYHLMDDTHSASRGGVVVRRGQPMSLRLTTNRRYDAATDKIGFVFTVTDCKNPSFGNGTQQGVMVGVKAGEGEWGVTLTLIEDASVSVTLSTPPDCIVGSWRVEVDIASAGTTHCYTCPYSLFILYNPWCPEDPTYLECEEERTEYVLRDTGLIWRGTATRLRPCAWHFAQFDENILDCVLFMLTEVCKMSAANRADPIKVARAISAGINSPDDKGVLVGNWSGEYDGGTSPTEWVGSVNILNQFYKSKKPVKFGQCWVFSGVVTTACRALGLPCRPVTNFSSAHDTHNSLTIDYFFDDEGETIDRLNSDSIWNFHVWNEVWMTRPDIGAEYGGWQVIDATPQEESDGQYRLGPSSLVAIKRGHIKQAFDVPFVFSEVNADKLYWKYRGPCLPMKLLGRQTCGVGLNISTKTVGRYTRNDITHLYKHAEDSTEERGVMRTALRRCENVFARYYLNEEIEDIEFDFQLIEDIVIGEPFTLSCIVTNKGSKDQNITVVLRADATLYTGVVKGLVKKEIFHRTMKPNTEEKLSCVVEFSEYYSKLADQCSLNVVCLGTVKETEFEYFAQDDFRMRKPDIKITPKGGFKVGCPTVCTMHFINPLPLELTRGFFYVIASGCKSQFINTSTIPPKGEVKAEMTLQPKASGELTITTCFLCKELNDVDGYLAVEVEGIVEEVGTEDDKPLDGVTMVEGVGGVACGRDGVATEDVELI